MSDCSWKAGQLLSAKTSRLLHQCAGQLVKWDLQFPSDPRSDREAWFALVLLEVGEVGLCHMRTGRQFGLGQPMSLTRGADFMPKRRETFVGSLAALASPPGSDRLRR